jgi:hypothetical protein
MSTVAPVSSSDSLTNLDRLRQFYKAPQQAEFLYLQAETESLLRQLESLSGKHGNDRN